MWDPIIILYIRCSYLSCTQVFPTVRRLQQIDMVNGILRLTQHDP